jgi:hypothetical protein
MRFGPLGRVTIALFAVGMCLAASASTAGTNRAEYVDRVETICRQATEANRGILEGVEAKIRRGELAAAASRFRRAAAALERVIDRLAAVPRPPADVERLARWLSHARAGAGLLERIGRLLEEGRRPKAERLATRLLREAKRANAEVVGFNFDYCRLNPARFA